MKDKGIPLNDWLAVPGNTQVKAAEVIGVTPGAVNQMIRSDREIYLVLDRKRQPIDYFEIVRRPRYGGMKQEKG